MKRKALFGGSFDPIHLGHISLAVEMLEMHHLDEVHFCPARQNPHKDHTPYVSSDDRVAMVQRAIAGFEGFRLNLLEIDQQDPCYSIDTLRSFIAADKSIGVEALYFLIIGEDCAKTFYSWREAENIVKLCTVLVGCRSQQEIQRLSWPGSLTIVEALQKGSTESRIMEISSSEIRQRISVGLPVAHLLNNDVLNYINQKKLYQRKND